MINTKEEIGPATLYNSAMEETIGDIQRVDHVLTDPPYLYIKTHDFDRPWDEPLFFENAKRMLPDNGFIALFGRGTSFYRWNTRLADLGFVFKEEIVWNKKHLSSPCLAISRIHETVSIHTKKTGTIRRSKVPYVEKKQHDVESVVNDIKRIKSAINSESGLNNILNFLERGKPFYCVKAANKHWVTTDNKLKTKDRAENILHSVINGMKEVSVIDLLREHQTMEHPTQKPVRLAERILALISDPGNTIYDPFMGSGSFGVACINTGRKYIGSEMKPEYFDIACRRIEKAVKEFQHEIF